MVKWYHEDLPYPNTVEQEIECWRHKFHSEDGVLPASALETLKTTQMSFFPNNPVYAENFSYTSSDNM